jgi:hypothetical protein
MRPDLVPGVGEPDKEEALRVWAAACRVTRSPALALWRAVYPSSVPSQSLGLRMEIARAGFYIIQL